MQNFKIKSKILMTLYMSVIFILLSGCGDQVSENKNTEVAARSLIIMDIYNSGNIDRALGLSKNLIDDYPEKPLSHWILGTMFIAFSQESEKGDKSYEKYVNSGLEELKKALSISNSLGDIDVMKMGVAYATVLHEQGKTDEALENFSLYYDKYEDKVVVAPESRYSVIAYSEALAKKGRFSEAINKYIYSLKINGSDPMLIEGYVKLQSDYIDFHDAIFIADSFERKNGLDSGVLFEKCRAFYTHKYIKEATGCFNKLILSIEIEDFFYEPSKKYLRELQEMPQGKKEDILTF